MFDNKEIKFLLLVVVCIIKCDIKLVKGERLRCLDMERQALLNFKQQLTDETGVLSSWGSRDHQTECCSWYGVTCSNATGGHVTRLTLNVFFGGKISPALLDLHYLNHLELMLNDFGGDPIPDFIGSIKMLEYLDLLDSNFSGVIPPQLGNLTNLRYLSLVENHLWFDNFYWHSRLSSLTDLDLSGNELSSSTTFHWLFNISTNLIFIDLSYNRLDGPIPDAFANLMFLEDIRLSFNMLEGEIPKSLGKLSHLKNLELSSNRLAGLLPTSLSQLSSLEALSLSYNSINGAISEAYFVELHNLTVLDLSFNPLTLNFSSSWVPPFSLKEIGLSRCIIGRGSFPKWVQTQRDLLYLDISLTGISGEVPKWLWNMSHIRILNLSHNQISGNIPDLSSSNSMYILDVSSNNFSGPIPFLNSKMKAFILSSNMFSGSISSICPHAVCEIQCLDVSNNQLTGPLPSNWTNMKQLVILSLNNNSFLGQIPHSMGLLSELRTLHLRGNNLSGELPTSLNNCQLLQQIDISENNFTAIIPQWLGVNRTSLVFLSLSHNMFFGDIPAEICRLTQLQLLDLSYNNLTGNIPKCFDKFIALADKNRAATTKITVLFRVSDYMDYAQVQWKGRMVEYKSILRFLKLIDLSSNKLVGSVPESFSTLKGLISLNLSRNGLTGSISSNVGEIEMLEVLDLSRNCLSGKIPIGLAKLNFLSVLDLASNNLTGEIPQSTQLSGFSVSSFDGNNGLCGSPLPSCINTFVATNRGDNDDIIDKDVWLTNLCTLAFGFVIGFWGIVGSLVLKRCWRNEYFNLVDTIWSWFTGYM